MRFLNSHKKEGKEEEKTAQFVCYDPIFYTYKKAKNRNEIKWVERVELAIKNTQCHMPHATCVQTKDFRANATLIAATDKAPQNATYQD